MLRRGAAPGRGLSDDDGVAWRGLFAAALLCLAAPGDGKAETKAGEVEVGPEAQFDSRVIDVAWLGWDKRAAVLLTHRGRLHRSGDGGRTWSEITGHLMAAAGQGPKNQTVHRGIVERIVINPADSNTLAGLGLNSAFISTDAGLNWRKMGIDSNINTFTFHSTRPTWALVTHWSGTCAKGASKTKEGTEGREVCSHKLFVTTDLGKSYRRVASHVVQASWGDVVHKHEDRIYFTRFRKTDADQPKLTHWMRGVDLAYSDDQGRSTVEAVKDGNKFAITNGYMLLVTVPSTKSGSVVLTVSNDGGKNFNDARLPHELRQQGYSLLDTSEGFVVLHVHTAQDVGDIYVSDRSGVEYTKSLSSNVRARGLAAFEKVMNLRGIYLANVRTEVSQNIGESRGSDNWAGEGDLEGASTGAQMDVARWLAEKDTRSHVRTVISFDKGGSWTYIRPPKFDSAWQPIDCPPKSCWLHLHDITTMGAFSPMYSYRNSVGIIMASGNVGPHLSSDPAATSTWLSRDAGLTWTEVHKGTFIYEFGNHGGLVVMANMKGATDEAQFSWDEGLSWKTFKFTRNPMVVDNVLIEADAQATDFVIYGERHGSGVLYHLDYGSIHKRLCHGLQDPGSPSSDYEQWTPSDGKSKDRCLMGQQVYYTRRKMASLCFNAQGVDRPKFSKKCPCTMESFECEVFFERAIGSMECKASPFMQRKLPGFLQCSSPNTYTAHPYRKVAGDVCEGGWQPPALKLPCPPGLDSHSGPWLLVALAVIVVATLALACVMWSPHFKAFRESFHMKPYAHVQSKVSEMGTRGRTGTYQPACIGSQNNPPPG